MDIKTDINLFKDENRMLMALRHAVAAMTYDHMTCAPRNSAAGFASSSAMISGEIHRITASPERASLLERLCSAKAELDPLTALEAEDAKKELERIKRIPPEAQMEFMKLKGEASAAWLKAKEANDHAAFAPYLDAMFACARELAAFAAPETDPYDYWLDKNEPGASQSTLDAFFALLREKIVPLLARISQRPGPDTSFLHGIFPIPRQREFSNELMRIMGIDRDSCTIAEVEHPYTMALDRRDVRITTHYFEGYVGANMFSVLHEGGHAIYEMGISEELSGSPLSAPASAGIHESQSRFYENVIGRSHAFAELILPVLKRFFPEQLEGVSADEFHRAVNAVEPTLKRTEADELTYCLHVMIRYELEKKLMRGELEAAGVPREWNRLYGEYLGITPHTDREGCLQDMHWGSGLIGYFPTYALGNAYAAQLAAAMRRELDVDKLVRSGDIPAITEWLGNKIHRFGKTRTPAELIKASCGEGFDPKYYIDYLEEKYTKLYNL